MEKTFKQKVCEIAIQNAVLFDKKILYNTNIAYVRVALIINTI